VARIDGTIYVVLEEGDEITVSSAQHGYGFVRLAGVAALVTDPDRSAHDSHARVAARLREAADQLDALDTDRPIPYALTERGDGTTSVDA
jgi:hypothetical protein